MSTRAHMFVFGASLCEILKAQQLSECDATIFKEASFVLSFQVIHLFMLGKNKT